jgi:2,3-bisphosphoglycerate-dependent phosphoglycerate mutase
MSLTTTMYLVRHAHSEWRDDEARPLSLAGRAAADGIAEQLAREPIVALYSSPSTRAIETITPLADRLGLSICVLPDLRERTLPAVAREQFEPLIAAAWDRPAEGPAGAESNLEAQTRGLVVVRSLLDRHRGARIVLSTHGNLLALVLNGLEPTHGYAFWRQLSFPDIYRVTFDRDDRIAIVREWTARDDE